MTELHAFRKIEVVVQAEDRPVVEQALRGAGVPGWTMIRDVAGQGHDGFHAGRTMFTDQSGLVMFVGVAARQVIAAAADALTGVFRTRSGVLFLSDVEVIRSGYFETAGAPAS